MNDQLNDTIEQKTERIFPVDLKIYRKGKNPPQMTCTVCGGNSDHPHEARRWNIFGISEPDYGNEIGPVVVCGTCMSNDIDERIELHAKMLEHKVEKLRRLKWLIRVPLPIYDDSPFSSF